MTRSRLQFRLVHALLAVALISALLGCIVRAGLLGAVLYGGACSIALICFGLFKRDGRYIVSGGISILVFFGLFLAGSTVAVGSGRSILPCSVLVVDAFNNPVVAATFRIRDVLMHDVSTAEGVPVHPIPADEPGVSGVTDASGVVTLAFEFLHSSRSGLFVHEAHVSISPYLWVQVDAPGYERELVRLDSAIGTAYDWDQLPLPQVEVQLTHAIQK